MKRFFTFISCLLLCVSFVFAQKQIYDSSLKKEEIKNSLVKKNFSMYEYKWGKKLNGQLPPPLLQANDRVNNLAKKSTGENVFTPYYTTHRSWSQWGNIDNGEVQYYEIEQVIENWGIKEMTIYPYDINLNPLTPIVISNLPSPSQVVIGSDRTEHFFTIRFFSNGEEQTWMVNYQGELVKKFEVAEFIGNNEIAVLTEKEGVYGFLFYNATTLELKSDNFIVYPDIETTPQSAFSSLLFEVIDNKEYFIIATIKGNLMIEDFNDPNFTNPEPNCMFNLYFYDVANNYSFEKEINIPLESLFTRVTIEDAEAGRGSLGVHSIKFGVSSVPFDWVISKHKFNDDDKLEIFFTVAREDFGGNSTEKFVVANEDGDIIQQFTPANLVVDLPLNQIEGENDEMIFVTVNTEQNAEQIEIVDVKTFNTKFIIPVQLHNLKPSVYLRRVKENNEVLYLVGMAEPEVIKLADQKYQSYAHIYKINSNLDLIQDIKLDLTFDEKYFPIAFTPALVYIDYKDWFSTDETTDYMYAADYSYFNESTQQYNQTGQRLYISKENEKPYFAPYNNPDFINTYGKYYMDGFIFDNETEKPKYMFVYSHDGKTVFFELPLLKDSHGIESEVVDNQFVFYSSVSKTLNFTEDISDVEVYSINGLRLYQGKGAQVSAASWIKGIYIVKAKDNAGAVYHQKVLVY